MASRETLARPRSAAWPAATAADVAADGDDPGGYDSSEEYSMDEESESGSDSEPLETTPGEVRLTPSLFPRRAATVFFEYPPLLRLIRRAQPHFVEPLGTGRRLAYKCHWERNCIKNAFTRAGFVRLSGGGHGGAWTAVWAKHPTVEAYGALGPHQKANHFPGSWCIGRKDRLLRCLARARRRHPAAYDFFPEGYVLPGEFGAWRRRAAAQKSAIWILKPVASSCGKGIRLVHRGNLKSVAREKKCVMQRYLHEPYLIDGRKFDLRIYVLVTEVDPLRVYIFEEGLARFSSHKYTLRNLKSRFAHLTNYSVNKKSKHFVPNADEGDVASGSKWSLSALLAKLEALEGAPARRRAEAGIRAVILKTLIAAEAELVPQAHQKVRHQGGCFELFGFDVMLDASLKAWLIEVNVSPSLMGSAPIDRKIKGTLMADLFHTVGYVPYDRAAAKRDPQASERVLTSARLKRQPSWRRSMSPDAIDPSCFGREDWDVIFNFEDEWSRCGHFELLFPRAHNVAALLPLFASPRLNNHLLAHWLLFRRRHELLGLLADPRDIRIDALRLTLRDPQKGHGRKTPRPGSAPPAESGRSSPLLFGSPSGPETQTRRPRSRGSDDPQLDYTRDEPPPKELVRSDAPAGAGARAAASLRPAGATADPRSHLVYAKLAQELRRLSPEEVHAVMEHLDDLQTRQRGRGVPNPRRSVRDPLQPPRKVSVAGKVPTAGRALSGNEVRVEQSMRRLTLEPSVGLQPREARYRGPSERGQPLGGGAFPHRQVRKTTEAAAGKRPAF